MIHNDAIKFTNVYKDYKKHLFRSRKNALNDLSFNVDVGEIFGIIGPNGAGKSTTLKILLGFIRQNSGEVLIYDSNSKDSRNHARLGFLPENPCLYDQLSITEHLQFAGSISGYSSSRTDKRISEVLQRFDLDHVKKDPIRGFSKGMTQRAALAYAMFCEPEILILDEPMSGLDPIGRQLVIDILRDYNENGNTILFCSHILSDVERICNRIGIMNKGRIVSTIYPKDDLSPQCDHYNKTPLEEIFLKAVSTEIAKSVRVRRLR